MKKYTHIYTFLNIEDLLDNTTLASSVSCIRTMLVKKGYQLRLSYNVCLEKGLESSHQLFVTLYMYTIYLSLCTHTANPNVVYVVALCYTHTSQSWWLPTNPFLKVSRVFLQFIWWDNVLIMVSILSANVINVELIL